MIRIALLSLALVAACKKDAPKPPPAAPAAIAQPPSADGVRRVAIAVDKDGFTPSRITGKPGEKLALVFTRTLDASCIAQVKTPDGKLVDLPMNTPVEVAVTVPDKGEVGFACGMDMFHGVIAAAP
jgi:plastocyanin domain-containing protein